MIENGLGRLLKFRRAEELDSVENPARGVFIHSCCLFVSLLPSPGIKKDAANLGPPAHGPGACVTVSTDRVAREKSTG